MRNIAKAVLNGLSDSLLNDIYSNCDGTYDEATAQAAGDVRDARSKADDALDETTGGMDIGRVSLVYSDIGATERSFETDVTIEDYLEYDLGRAPTQEESKAAYDALDSANCFAEDLIKHDDGFLDYLKEKHYAEFVQAEKDAEAQR